MVAPRQRLLPFPEPVPRTAGDLADHLARLLGAPVRVRLGRAQRTPVRAQRVGPARRPCQWELHLHRAFVGADPTVLADLGAWLRSGRRARRASARLDAWIADHVTPGAPPALRPVGRHRDLGVLAAPLLGGPFAGDFAPPARPPGLTWGRRGRSAARRSLQLGCYVGEDHLVRIHPVLDGPAVPGWFLGFLLFHELLHAALPDEGHSRAFRARERRHPDHDRARRWERRHLRELIRCAREGRAYGEGVPESAPRAGIPPVPDGTTPP